MKQHPLSAIFPAMPPDELLALSKDIKKNGLQQAVYMYEGMVIDGWHRVQACKMAGVQVREEKYSGSDPVGFVRSRNWHRRHMTASQRALTEVQLSEWAPAGRPKESAPFGAGKPISAMANDSGTSVHSIKDARQVEKNGADVLKEAVKENKISIRTAAEISKKPKAKQAKALKEAKAPRPKAISKPTDPKKCPNRDTCEVVEELAELKDNYEALADDAKTYDAVMGGAAAVEMQKLREQLKQATRRRDELMAQAVEMRRQIGYWKGAAKKAGWKPKDATK